MSNYGPLSIDYELNNNNQHAYYPTRNPRIKIAKAPGAAPAYGY